MIYSHKEKRTRVASQFFSMKLALRQMKFGITPFDTSCLHDTQGASCQVRCGLGRSPQRRCRPYLWKIFSKDISKISTFATYVKKHINSSGLGLIRQVFKG